MCNFNPYYLYKIFYMTEKSRLLDYLKKSIFIIYCKIIKHEAELKVTKS